MPGCDVPVGERFLMCRPHWRLVPPDFRDELHSAYQLARTARAQRLIAEYAVAVALESITHSCPLPAGD